MTTNANTIHLKGGFRLEEIVTAAAITPGHLIESYNVAGVENCRVHSTEGGFANRMFASEDALQGNTIDDAYAAADIVQAQVEDAGAEVQGWLKAGESVVAGDKLISAGDGTLIENGSEASGTTVKQIVAEAMETLDLSASGAVATRLDIRLF